MSHLYNTEEEEDDSLPRQLHRYQETVRATDEADVDNDVDKLSTYLERSQNNSKSKRKRFARSKYNTSRLVATESASLSDSDSEQHISHDELGLSAADVAAAAASRPAPAKPCDEWNYVAPQELRFPDVDPSGADVNDVYCFMCDCTQNSKEMQTNPRYVRLKSTWDKCCGSMEPVELCKLIQKDYEEVLRKRTLDQRSWTLRSIYAHFTHHAPSHISLLEDSLRVMNSAMTLVKNERMFMRETKSKKQKLDVSGASMYLTFFKQRRELIKEIVGKRPVNIA
jgi:hypothetical protein